MRAFYKIFYLYFALPSTPRLLMLKTIVYVLRKPCFCNTYVILWCFFFSFFSFFTEKLQVNPHQNSICLTMRSEGSEHLPDSSPLLQVSAILERVLKVCFVISDLRQGSCRKSEMPAQSHQRSPSVIPGLENTPQSCRQGQLTSSTG